MFRVHYQSPLTLTSHIDINLMVSENKLHIPESPKPKMQFTVMRRDEKLATVAHNVRLLANLKCWDAYSSSSCFPQSFSEPCPLISTSHS